MYKYFIIIALSIIVIILSISVFSFVERKFDESKTWLIDLCFFISLISIPISAVLVIYSLIKLLEQIYFLFV